MLLLAAAGCWWSYHLKARQREWERLRALSIAERERHKAQLEKRELQAEIRHTELEALAQTLQARGCQLEEQNKDLQRQKASIERQTQQLDEAHKAKSRFFANVSHEFRTSLTLVKLPLLDMRAAQNPDEAAPSSARFDLMLHNIERLEGQLDQLLDLSSIEGGHLRLHVRLHDAAAFLRHAAGRFLDLAAQQHVDLTITAPSYPVLLYLDIEKCDKIISNLLSNALKFTPEGGHVSVTLEDEAETVEIRVEDTGVGISEESLLHIFDRFYRAESTAKLGRGGMGIGLSLTKELVNLHGGRLEVESALGQGSLFSFTLPRGRAHLSPEDYEHPVGEPPAPPDVLQPFTGEVVLDDGDEIPTLLLVEDDPDLRTYLAQALVKHYHVIEAGDGEEGLERAHRYRPDLILCDVMMPGIGGIALCRRIKEDDHLRGTPVLLLSAVTSEQSRLAGLAAGADDYVVKPFSLRELEARLHNHLHRRLDRSAPPNAQSPLFYSLPEANGAFLEKLHATVLLHATDPSFGVDELAREVALSPRQLQRKVHDHTGQSPQAYVRTLRLQHARRLLQNGTYPTIAEVAAAVGFSRNYFYRLYRQHYGHAASEDQAASR